MAIVVARTLGATSLGQYSFLFVLLTLLVSMQTSWVGDALTVLDRSNANIMRGVASTQWAHVLSALIVGPLLAVGLARTGPAAATVFGVLVAAWELEEFGRRILMARLEFGRQLLADGSYCVATLVALAAWSRITTPSLTSVLLSMVCGAFFSFAVEMALVPAHERLLIARPRFEELKVVARFGFWRAAQAAAGYFSQVAFRSLIILFGSFAVLGTVEAARLIVAPLFTLLGALANLLLPYFARSRDQLNSRLVAAIAAALAVPVVVYSVAATLFLPEAAHLITGGHFSVGHTPVLAWMFVAFAAATSTPCALAWVALGRSQSVFKVKLFGSALGLALATMMLTFGWTLLSPIGVGVGNVVSAIVLIRVPTNARTRTLHWSSDTDPAASVP